MSAEGLHDLTLSPEAAPLPAPTTATRRSLRPRRSVSRVSSRSGSTNSSDSTRSISFTALNNVLGRSAMSNLSYLSSAPDLAGSSLDSEGGAGPSVGHPTIGSADADQHGCFSSDLSELSDPSEDDPAPVSVPQKRPLTRQRVKGRSKRTRKNHSAPSPELGDQGHPLEEVLPDLGVHLPSGASHNPTSSHVSDVVSQDAHHLSRAGAEELSTPASLPVDHSIPVPSAALTDDVIAVDELSPATSRPHAAHGLPDASTDTAVASSSRLDGEFPPAVPHTVAPSASAPSVEPLSTYPCPICFSPPSYATLTPCGHVCCGECLFTAVKTAMQRATYYGPVGERLIARCPVCRAPIPGWDGRGGGVIGLKPRAVFTL